MIQVKVKKDLSLYSHSFDHQEFWEAETEEELIMDFADHLYEHETQSIQIVNTYNVLDCGEIKAFTSGENWELQDKINERLQLLRNDYHDYIDSCCKEDLFYKMAVL